MCIRDRFWDYQKGSITVGGMEVSQIDPEKLMSLYSIVFQDVTLFDNTILENIRLGRKEMCIRDRPTTLSFAMVRMQML